jgi:hypothetical protein
MLACGACGHGCTAHSDDLAPPFTVEPLGQTLIAGRDFTCHLRSNEALCWGGEYANADPLLGDLQWVENATQIAIGWAYWTSDVERVCAIDHKGRLSCDFDVPDLGPASDVAIGYDHACAVLVETDRVACWPIMRGTRGRRAPQPTFYDVPQTVTVAVNQKHACALTRSGRVVCWGLEGDCPPRWITDFGVGVDISARMDTCVADLEGVVRCLAPTSCPNPWAPDLTQAPDVAHARRVATGNTMNCAVTGSQVRCWPASQLDGEQEDATLLAEPVQFQRDTEVRELALGARHACVLTASGSVECWGNNRLHQLDGPGPTMIDTPRAVPGLVDVSEVHVGFRQSCARQTGGAVHCWGVTNPSDEQWSGLPRRIAALEGVALFGTGGPAGVLTVTGSIEYLSEPAESDDEHPPESYDAQWLGTAMRRGELNRVERTTAPDDSWQLLCAIWNTQPPVCATFAKGSRTPTTAPQVLTGVRDLALCHDQAWLIDTEGEVSLARPLDLEHVRAVELSAPAIGIACRGADACALLEDGAAACWSDTEFSNPLYPDDPIVIPLERAASSLAMGYESACAWSHDGQVECWGALNASSLAFASSRTRVELPATLPGVSDAVRVSISGSHGCVVHTHGGVSCWGFNYEGQAGGGSGEWHKQPVEVPLP